MPESPVAAATDQQHYPPRGGDRLAMGRLLFFIDYGGKEGNHASEILFWALSLRGITVPKVRARATYREKTTSKTPIHFAKGFGSCAYVYPPGGLPSRRCYFTGIRGAAYD